MYLENIGGESVGCRLHRLVWADKGNVEVPVSTPGGLQPKKESKQAEGNAPEQSGTH